MEGKHYSEFVPPDRLDRFEWIFARALNGQVTRAEYPIGSSVMELEAVPIIEDDEITHVAFYMHDTTAERNKENALKAKNALDSLTSLPRRALLQTHVDNLMRLDSRFVLLFIDLDKFKSVNDTFGHQTGDILLQKVAGRLQASIRSGDLAVRIGGDEFVVVLGDPLDPRAIAERVLKNILSVTEPYGAGASVGLALYPEDGRTLEALLQLADNAMYDVKKDGGDAVRRGYAD